MIRDPWESNPPAPLVPEQELFASLVQFNPVDLRVVRYLAQGVAEDEILERDRLEVEQVGQPLDLFRAPHLPLVDANADQVRVHELRPHGAQDLVLAVLDEAQFAGVEYHADVGILEIVLLVAAAVCPRNLAEEVPLEVAEEKRLRGLGNEEGVPAHDADVLDFVAVDRLQDHPPRSFGQRFHEDLTRPHVGHLEAVLPDGPLEHRLEELYPAAEGADRNAGTVALPTDGGDAVQMRDFLEVDETIASYGSGI